MIPKKCYISSHSPSFFIGQSISILSPQLNMDYDIMVEW